MSERVTVDVHIGADEWRTSLRADALKGLQSTPKNMPPTWFYDDYGSELFDQITALPEYYLTRAERSIRSVICTSPIPSPRRCNRSGWAKLACSSS